MNERLQSIRRRYDELSERIASPDSMKDMDAWRVLVKEHAQLEPIAHKSEAYARLLSALEDCRLMREDGDPEMREMAEEEFQTLSEEVAKTEEEIRILLLPRDPNEDRNVVMEIRAGTGGEEAALFASNLYRMYSRYAERHGFSVEPMNENLTELGGIKESIFVINGRGAYARLKFESGVHRVQRVPETESGGRIHTSAATVAVLPEAEDVEVTIAPNDLRVDVYRSSGHGGQSVNTTDSAVRITHLPTGLVVTCQDEKSQLKNKEKAMRILKSRLYDRIRAEQDQAFSQNRRSQIGSGDRSERIRTYNFPQGRVTDHRIGVTVYKLEAFMDGDCDEIIDALILQERTELLSGEQAD
ncbi:MAG: peptide chain release factor 1 [Clostridia bacterium]|nr:peptide chain release factor 1 [Clostridia bacterium]